ncbi:MAG: hypothetical protein IJ594_11120 [Oscillospiraceae bacterium]|nr:hypothetical protein [Oscillospiraceae bacterium]
MLWLLILVIAVCAVFGFAVCFGILDDLHVKPRPIAGRKRVACVGDSITYGCLLPGQPWNSYPRQLGRLLGSGYCVGNFGYSNRTALKSANHPYTAEKLYRWSLDYQPDYVLLMLGSNDTKTENWDAAGYARDLGDLIESYRGLESRPRVWLLLPPPAFPFRGKVLWDIRSEVLEQEVIPICRQVAAEKGITLIDTHTPFEGRRELFTDGLHPGARGGKLLAETVYGAIRGELDG